MTRRAETLPISVIIPAYNSAGALPEAIDSALAQTCPAAEIIVVDDGSTDETATVAQARGVQVLRREHAGPSATRNHGIRTATSPWLAFLDADDIWDPGKLERQWAAATLCEAGLVSCDQRTFNQKDETLDVSCLGRPGMRYDDLERTSVAPGIEHIPAIAAQLHMVGWFLFPSTIVVRRDLLLEAGLFDEALAYCEDLECFLRVLTRTSLAMVREPLVRRRVHDSSASSNALGMILGRLGVIERMRARPDRYPATVVGAMASEVPGLLLEAARLLLHAGRRAEARRHLLRTLRQRPSPAGVALLAASWVDPRHFQRLRPTIRWIRSFGHR